MVILRLAEQCIEKCVGYLVDLDIDPNDIVAIGITNQRETTILWDSKTGKPLYNAIVWSDVRTKGIVDEYSSRLKNTEFLRTICGLPISTYFSAVKINWLLNNVEEVQSAVKDNRCLFGTVDSWLVWNLTGGTDGGLHITDVTNASRTLLMNLRSLSWDPHLLSLFSIPSQILPQIRSSSEIYAYLKAGPLEGVPISGILGDQQSALMGQSCLAPGQAKNTYGTGCFLLYNTGTAIVNSNHGLLTTVAYQLGPRAPITYALEGSIAVAGQAFKWLRDNLNLIGDLNEIESLVQNNISHSSSGDVVFVPAFSGLYAPYWKRDARSILCGLTDETSKADIVQAALEAVCFQTRDILEAMREDCGVALEKLLVDGGMTGNKYLMQLQADLTGVPVIRPLMAEATALGAAMAAGCAEGINAWDPAKTTPPCSDEFYPSIDDNERDMRYVKWKKGIKRSMGWDLATKKDAKNIEDLKSWQQLVQNVAVFTFVSFSLLIVARKLAS
uniref:glycerol kinase n=2 Tax=Cacopsylla melanoneura TaxID=428564 RepID=A0A8D9FB89_9HEMI